MPTYGQRPDDVVTDSRGNAQPGVLLKLYTTQALAEAGGTPLGTATTGYDGTWTYETDELDLYARTPNGRVWQVAQSVEALVSAAEASATASAESATLAQDALNAASSAQSAADASAASAAAAAASAAALAARIPSLEPLRAALDAGERSCAVQVLGDSTGDATDEWVYTLAQSVATSYPGWTVRYKAWDDAAQDYAATTTIQTGTDGVRAMVVASGTQTRRLAASASPHISGAIDVRIRMSLTDWTPTAAHTPIGKTDVAGARGWYCGINNQASGNRPYFVFSTDGTALTTMTVIGTPTVSDGDTLWMRWVFVPNDGGGNRTLAAYQSPDGVTWTQIGATVTTAGAVTLFNNSTVGYSLGGEAAGVNAPGATIYEVEIRDGVDGASVVPALPDLWTPNPVSTASTIPVTGAPVLTFVNGSKSGATISYWADTTRIKKGTPPFGQCAAFLSLSHNQANSFGSAFVAEYEAWRQQVEARLPGCPSVVLTQNPETAASVNASQHAQRRRDLLATARQKAVGVVDTYQDFLDYGDWEGDLMLDSVHPNAAGSLVWRDAVLTAAGLA